MKGKPGRPRIPLSGITNKKSGGFADSKSAEPFQLSPSNDESADVQMASGGKTKKRLDKKSRGGKTKWMQDLKIKKGAMTEAAEREGVSNSEYEQEHKSDSGKAGKRARLALTFKKADKKK